MANCEIRWPFSPSLVWLPRSTLPAAVRRPLSQAQPPPRARAGLAMLLGRRRLTAVEESSTSSRCFSVPDHVSPSQPSPASRQKALSDTPAPELASPHAPTPLTGRRFPLSDCTPRRHTYWQLAVVPLQFFRHGRGQGRRAIRVRSIQAIVSMRRSRSARSMSSNLRAG